VTVLPHLASRRSDLVQESIIRRVFEEGRHIPGIINLTIGQPDFPVAPEVKRAAIDAIASDKNGYTPNRGADALLDTLASHLKWDLGWDVSPTGKDERPGVFVTAGTTGGLCAAAMCLLDPGDEIIVPDPYFVLYPPLGQMTGAKVVLCDTYPDFCMTAARVEPLITPRTKAVLICSPSNPCGVVNSARECRELLDLCRRRGIMLISDEIYDEFTYSDGKTQPAAGDSNVLRCPSPCRLEAGPDGQTRDAGEQEHTLLIRGFGKTYGCTGWRLGYAAGPKWLIDRMVKVAQHLYICAPGPLQLGALAAFGVDMSGAIGEYTRRRDTVVRTLSEVTEVAHPAGAFYAFVKVPERLGMTATQFKDAAKARKVLIVPGCAFSPRDTHFRLSYATDPARLGEGVAILRDLLTGK
jgi:aspartate/methionine/tyrosine aminotransferase